MNKEQVKPIELRIDDFQHHMLEVEILKHKEAYGYNYAPLETIIPTILPILKKYGIGYNHRTDIHDATGQNIVITRVFSLDNVEDFVQCKTLIDKEAKLAKMNQFMVEGSAITYFRRYHLVTILGLLTDEDNDAGGGRQTGRSVESNASRVGPDYVDIFSKLIEKGKTENQVKNSFENYKKQMSNEQIEAVEKLLKDKYGN